MKFEHFNLDDATFFLIKIREAIVYLIVYVVDILMTGHNEMYIASIKKELKKIFKMIDLGILHYYLGIE